MNNILKVIAVIIGSLIGAGFASGQEIYIFFYSYGIKGILGIMVCCLLIGIIIYKVLKTIKQNKIDTYRSFLEFITPRKSKNRYLNFNFIINCIINIFLLITFYIMIAGFGAFFCQEVGIHQLIGSRYIGNNMLFNYFN